MVRMRQTRQKQAIRAAFSQTDRPLSPEEVLRYAKRHYNKVGIATVYRNIKALVEDAWLVPLDVPGKSTRYELAGKRHHHHFHCNQCDKTYELEGCVASAKPSLPRGFTSLAHEFFVFGVCVGCSTRLHDGRA